MVGSEGFGGKEWTEGGERSVFLPSPFTQTQGPFLQLDRRYDEACYFKQEEQVRRKGGGCIRPYPFLVKTPLLELQYIRFNSYIYMQ